MSNLMDRYTKGNISLPPGPAHDFLFGIPARQKEMISLAKDQIASNQHAAQLIAQSNFESAQMMINEMNKQSIELQSIIDESADRVIESINLLSTRVCTELSGIRWELSQIKSLTEEILGVLKTQRKIEAQELNRQAIRNMINGKNDEAEKRLLQAYELDNTDYSVLMNLSYLSLNKNDSKDAIRYTEDAFNMPGDLDNDSKANALWSLSRIYYTLKQYDKCVDQAKESLKFVSTPKRVYQTGVYAVLANRKEEGFSLIKKAILQESSIYSLAITDPDLSSVRNEILAMLDKLSADGIKSLKNSFAEVERDLMPLSESKLKSEYIDLLERVNSEILKTKKVLNNATYSDVVFHNVRIKDLMSALAWLKPLDSLYAERKVLLDDIDKKGKRLTQVKETFDQASKSSQDLTQNLWIRGCLTYLGGAIAIGIFMFVSFFILGEAVAVIGPLMIFLLIIFIIVHIVNRRKSVKEKFSTAKNTSEFVGKEFVEAETVLNRTNQNIKAHIENFDRLMPG